MIPFLKNKDRSSGGVSVEYRTPDETSEPKDEGKQALEACALDIIKAVEMKDHKALARSLQDAFEIYDSMPKESDYEFESDGDTE